MLTRGQKARRSQQQLDAIQALSGHVLELGPVATLLVLQLSVRQLWLLKRVNRYMYFGRAHDQAKRRGSSGCEGRAWGESSHCHRIHHSLTQRILLATVALSRVLRNTTPPRQNRFGCT